jgi:hypothetical protein
VSEVIQIINVRRDVKSTVLRNIRKLDEDGLRAFIEARGFRSLNYKDDLELALTLASNEVDSMSTPELQAYL